MRKAAKLTRGQVTRRYKAYDKQEAERRMVDEWADAAEEMKLEETLSGAGKGPNPPESALDDIMWTAEKVEGAIHFVGPRLQHPSAPPILDTP